MTGSTSDSQRTKWVYDFAGGNRNLKDLLGGKGANLAEMTNLGLPVPPGFTITTDACQAYLTTGDIPAELDQEIDEHLATLEVARGRRLGDPDDPLLVSVRSGAKFSMPGMMDTVLNIGLNDVSVHALARQTGDARFAWDSYRRLIQMFGKTVLHVDGERFEAALEEAKASKGTTSDLDLGPSELKKLVESFKTIVQQHSGAPFPQDVRAQLDAGSGRYFRRGTPTARCCTGGRSASPRTSAPPSPCVRWCSATWAWTRAPGSRSPGIRAPASPASTATTCRTPRARTWCPASGTPCRCRTWGASTRPPMTSCSQS